MNQNENADRIPELDGVRGLAILMVLIYHLTIEAAGYFKNPVIDVINTVSQMGWIGVDVFFVLSGFLITSILLRTKKEKDYFKKFYARRILRIFPLYYVAITVIFLFLPL